jgi:Spy/CpxP family protein refolding chaperone
MSKSSFSKQVIVAVGILLCASAAPGLALAQSAASAGGPPPTIAAPPPTIAAPPAPQSSQRARQVTDIFAGLTYTDDQKAKINEIRQNTKAHVDVVIKDDKLDSYQKQAMVQGFQRLEAGEIFKILTPEQQKDVRKKLSARRTAERDQPKPQQPPPVAPH